MLFNFRAYSTAVIPFVFRLDQRSCTRRVIQRNAYPLAPIVFPAIAWLIQYRPFWRLLPWGNNHPSWAEIRRMLLSWAEAPGCTKLLPSRRTLRESSEPFCNRSPGSRSEEHTSEFQSLMRSTYAVFCLI